MSVTHKLECRSQVGMGTLPCDCGANEAQQEIFNRYWDMFRADYPDHVEKGVEFLLGFIVTVVTLTADDPHFSLQECATLILQARGSLNLTPKARGPVQ